MKTRNTPSVIFNTLSPTKVFTFLSKKIFLCFILLVGMTCMVKGQTSCTTNAIFTYTSSIPTGYVCNLLTNNTFTPSVLPLVTSGGSNGNTAEAPMGCNASPSGDGVHGRTGPNTTNDVVPQWVTAWGTPQIQPFSNSTDVTCGTAANTLPQNGYYAVMGAFGTYFSYYLNSVATGEAMMHCVNIIYGHTYYLSFFLRTVYVSGSNSGASLDDFYITLFNNTVLPPSSCYWQDDIANAPTGSAVQNIVHLSSISTGSCFTQYVYCFTANANYDHIVFYPSETSINAEGIAAHVAYPELIDVSDSHSNPTVSLNVAACNYEINEPCQFQNMSQYLTWSSSIGTLSSSTQSLPFNVSTTASCVPGTLSASINTSCYTQYVTLTTPSLPSFTVGGASTICPGITSSSYSISTSGGSFNQGTIYNWTTSLGPASIAGSYTGTSILVDWPTSIPASTVTITANASYACVAATETETVITPSIPPFTIGGPTSGCTGSTGVYTIYPSSSFPTGTTYTWSIPSSDAANTSIPSHTDLIDAGVYWSSTIPSTGTDVDATVSYLGCSESESFHIAPPFIPDFTITGPQNICATATPAAVYTMVPSSWQFESGTSYSWSMTPSTGYGAITGNSTTPTIGDASWTSTPPSGGVTITGSVSYCGTTVSQTYVVMPPAVSAFTITGPNTICPNTTSTYTINASTSFPTGASVSWTASGGTIIASTNTSATVQWTSIPSGGADIVVTVTDCGVTSTQTFHSCPCPISQ